MTKNETIIVSRAVKPNGGDYTHPNRWTWKHRSTEEVAQCARHASDLMRRIHTFLYIIQISHLCDGVVRQDDWPWRCEQLVINLHRLDWEASSLLCWVNLEIHPDVFKQSMHDLSQNNLGELRPANRSNYTLYKTKQSLIKSFNEQELVKYI